MPAGYTLPLIALPAVTEPGAIFDIAIARTQEIIVGILCANIVVAAILPNRLTRHSSNALTRGSVTPRST